MASSVSPRGPLPARVYWVRRLLVVGVPLLLVVVLVRLLGGSSDGRDQAGAADDRATQAGARTVDRGPVDGPLQGPTAQPVEPAEPVLAEPTGPCADSDVVATPVITSVPGNSDAAITFNLRTVTAPACTWQASSDTMTVTITSGSDHIWSSRECPDSIPPQDVVVRQEVDAPVVVTWAGAKRSDETCSGRAGWAMPGFYHVEAAALGGEATDVQFELVPPSAPVVTETAQPEDQGGKNGGKNGGRNGETEHVPGEDGAGNSDG